MNINMILYIMENVQNVMKIMLENQEEDCKIDLMNIREKIGSLTFSDTPTKKITKVCPETISKFLEMYTRTRNLNGIYLRHYTLKSYAPL